MERGRRNRRSRGKGSRKRERRRKLIRALAARGILLVILVFVISMIVKGAAGLISGFMDSRKDEMAQIMEENEGKVFPTLIMMEDEGGGTGSASSDAAETPGAQDPSSGSESVPETQAPSQTATRSYSYSEDGVVGLNSPEFTSPHGILINTDEGRVVASRGGHDRIVPASMTKVMTLLLACEYISANNISVDDKVEVTIEATDYSYSNDCSNAGFEVGEQVRIYDLLCGTIMPSGADAAYTLACFVSGSHEAFVDEMNKKLEELHLPDPAHFTNCVGIHDDNHYISLYDMAVIMNAAMDQPLAREILAHKKYTTAPTQQHPDGIPMSNLFLRRIEDWDTLGEVTGAKTGFVNEAGFCAVSSYTCNDGKHYICVSAGGAGKWKPIRDHSAAYNIYAAGNKSYHRD